jgi:hypothetical protein
VDWLARVDGLRRWAERERRGLLAGVSLLVGVAAVRTFLEKVLLSEDGVGPFSGTFIARQYKDPWNAVPGAGYVTLDSLAAWASQLAWFVLLFLAVVAIASAVGRLPPRRILRAGLAAWPLLLVAPVLDRALFAAVPALYTCADPAGGVRATVSLSCYEVLNFGHAGNDASSVLLQPGVPWGLRLEALGTSALVAAYVLSATRSGGRAAASGLATLLAVGILGTLYAPGSAGDIATGPFASAGQMLQVQRLLLFSAAAAFLALWLAHREAPAVVGFVLRTPGLWWGGVVVIGALYGLLLSRPHPGSVLLLIVAAAAATWGASALVADAWGPTTFPRDVRVLTTYLLALVPFVYRPGPAPLFSVLSVLILAIVVILAAPSLYKSLGPRRPDRRPSSPAAPISGRAMRDIALAGLAAAAGMGALLGAPAFLAVAALGALSWIVAALLRVRRAMAENLPLLHAVLFLGVGYFAYNPAASGASGMLVLGNLALSVPQANATFDATLAVAGLLVLLVPFAGTAAQAWIARRPTAGPGPLQGAP